MNYRRLGRSGIKLSELSLGAWVTYGGQVSEDVARECMAIAYDAGVNFFDNAEVYANGNAEIVMGRIIKQLAWRRENIVVSTKIYWGGDGPNDTGLSHKHIIEGVNNALRRLQMDYIDLVFCHRPDPNTPIEETVRAMDIVIKQGKAFYWGTSEWDASSIIRADGLARQYGLTPPVMEQSQYNMLVRERVEQHLMPIYTELGYGMTVWSPLASGLLTGKYNNGIPVESRLAIKDYEWLRDEILIPEHIAKVKQLQEVSADLGCSLAQMSLAWCLKNSNISTVITGASNITQIKENMQAVEVVPKLTSEVMARIDEILQS
jgi:voltage-dependent potassium channel beta subunit